MNSNLVALVDESDYYNLIGYRWHRQSNVTDKTWYARTCVNGKHILMHRMIMKPGKYEKVDHIDRNGLNNCRNNLRIGQHTENRDKFLKLKETSSKYKGVSFMKDRNKWIAYINIEGKRKYLGFFEKEEYAALAYNEAARELFGIHAALNRVE